MIAYYLFDYLMLRVYVFLFLCILALIICMKRKINNGSIIINLVYIVPIAYFSSIMIPSYTFVFPFSNIEDAYEYNFPSGELIYKKQYKNTVFVYGRNSSNLYDDAVTFFTKENGKWICHRYQKDFRKGESCAFVENGALEMYALYSSYDDVTGVFIVPWQTDDVHKVSIQDSMNSSFDSFIGTLNIRVEKAENKIAYFAIIDGEIDKNYYVLVDGKKYVLSEYPATCGAKKTK